jgi:hypothetical protein
MECGWSVLLVDLESHADVIPSNRYLRLATQMEIVLFGDSVECVLELRSKSVEIGVVDLESPAVPVDVGRGAGGRSIGAAGDDSECRA